MDLFSSSGDKKELPLAARMRAETLDEFIGQEHLVGKGRLLRRAIQADQLSSLIFYGPPGTGKTTLAKIIAKTTKSAFITINAVLSGVKEIRDEIIDAKKRLELYDKKTILFVDEVHRWNKAQQDALLPWVENGTFILIGATTENPFYEVNSALVSRSRIFQLLPLSKENLLKAAERALKDKEKGYGKYKIEFEKGALDHLADIANGDARSLFNALQLAVETTPKQFPPTQDETIYISMEIAEESIQRRVLLYDKEGDYHFDVISAFIKSIRGSDPDATLYWLARMLDAGEDPKFILRRMIISAAEDIGLADPNALVVVNAAAQAFERIGMPEGQLILSEASLYLACTKKSNSALSIFDALKTIREEKHMEVPVNIKDASRDKESFGHGKNYLYPHAYKDHWVAQQYLPDALKGKFFYAPGETGFEADLMKEISRRREAQIEAQMERDDSDQETLTFSPPDKKKDEWYKRTSDNKNIILSAVREKIFSQINIKRHDRILIASRDRGLLIWEAQRHVPEGGVFYINNNKPDIEVIDKHSIYAEISEKPILINDNPEHYLQEEKETGIYDIAIARNLFLKQNNIKNISDKLFTILDMEGRISLAESLPSKSSRISQFMDSTAFSNKDFDIFLNAEKNIYENNKYGISLDIDNLKKTLHDSGFKKIAFREKDWFETRIITKNDIEKWFDESKESYGSIIISLIEKDLYKSIKEQALERLPGKEINWKSTYVFITAVKE
ncbi:MAG: AAA family ATPase [Spirochaetaceae bacterium]|nr:AAA family ATPase [Spirochaetaceae bacterium]